MSKHRFASIWSNIHYVNTAAFTATEKKAKKRANGFWQLSPWLVKLAANFGAYYHPSQCLDVDEMSIWFKGRHHLRFYNPNKPEKFHFKAFCLNDGRSGYLLDFFMYQGSAEPRPAGTSATAWPVIKLLSPVRYHDNGFILSTDNWYTSMETAHFLLDAGIHFNCTIKTNRSSTPKHLAFKKTGRGKKARGTMVSASTDYKEHKIYWTCWQDSKPVTVLSSYATYKSPVERQQKSAEGVWGPVVFLRPTVVEHYNWGMGGTDQQDQLASYYRYEHKTIYWTHRLISHFLMSITVNAHILYKEKMNKKMALVDFIKVLINQLAGFEKPPQDEFEEDSDDSSAESEVNPKRRRQSKTWEADLSRIVPSMHCPTIVKGGRGKCKAGCGKFTQMKCVECDTFLCCTGEKLENCFYRFHHCKKLDP